MENQYRIALKMVDGSKYHVVSSRRAAQFMAALRRETELSKGNVMPFARTEDGSFVNLRYVMAIKDKEGEA